MSDDRQEPVADEDPGESTRPLPPAQRPGDAEPAASGGGPAPGGGGPVAGGGIVPGGGRSAPGGGGRVVPGGTGPGRTSSAWSGRAGVPPPRPAGHPEPARGEWDPGDQGDRRWWLPILVASVVLVLLAVLGLGLWLIARAELDAGPVEPPPSTAVATSAGPPTASPDPTTATTGAPTTDAPARIPMPPLVGLPQAVAETVLDRLGLGYRVELRRSDRPAGTVIGTDPAAGTSVSAGRDVTLVVAEGAAATSPPTATPTPATPPAVTPTATG
ncbi:PASTA domain-containing protein [Micromonospora sp. WMMD882]|uniref:PASTA domain-containing protein n=1 Tax=Micromonospora sp. WMMD882 TaxID=3015151 RepID=UPI00248BB3E7|nr:PASTA domain-containing protein [Micromonospora sp. WMMD882]WBB78281.1 PASTA domain-containing protein [Micromonospora sp. WMMD882]